MHCIYLNPHEAVRKPLFTSDISLRVSITGVVCHGFVILKIRGLNANAEVAMTEMVMTEVGTAEMVMAEVVSTNVEIAKIEGIQVMTAKVTRT